MVLQFAAPAGKATQDRRAGPDRGAGHPGAHVVTVEAIAKRAGRIAPKDALIVRLRRRRAAHRPGGTLRSRRTEP